MKKLACFIIIFILAVNLTGCEALSKKFRRKKKEPPKRPRIYQVKKYEKKPTPELYKKHFAYWASWQSELIQALGKNQKKDARCIEEIVSNLIDMQNILVKEKGAELAPHIEKMIKVKEVIFKEDLTQANRDYIVRTLEREESFVRRNFYYGKVKNYLKKDFNEPEAPVSQS